MGMLREWFLLLRPPPANMFGWRVPSLDPLELVKWDALCLWCTNLLWWLKHIWTQRKNKSVRFDQLSFGCGGRIQNVWDQPERSLVVYPVHPHFTWLNQLDSSCSFLNSQVHRMSLTSPVKTWAPNGRFAAGRPHGAIPSWLENVAESCSMPLCFKKNWDGKSMAFPGCTRFPVINGDSCPYRCAVDTVVPGQFHFVDGVTLFHDHRMLADHQAGDPSWKTCTG